MVYYLSHKRRRIGETAKDSSAVKQRRPAVVGPSYAPVFRDRPVWFVVAGETAVRRGVRLTSELFFKCFARWISVINKYFMVNIINVCECRRHPPHLVVWLDRGLFGRDPTWNRRALSTEQTTFRSASPDWSRLTQKNGRRLLPINWCFLLLLLTIVEVCLDDTSTFCWRVDFQCLP